MGCHHGSVGEFRVVFTAADYDRTVAWFTDVIGLAVLRSFEEGGRGTILLAADGQIEVFAHDAPGAPPAVAGAALAWQIDDADAEHRRLSDAGASLQGEPTTQPWGHKSFRVDGPDGWVITLFEVLDAS